MFIRRAINGSAANAVLSGSPKSARILLLLVIGIFILLSGYYSIVTPVLETPDEVWHYAYVRQLAVHRALPVVDAEGKAPYRHEGLQPPLYYAIGSLFIAGMPERDLESMPAPNPYARIGEPRAATNDNRNAFLHTADEQFPFHGTALAVHLVRFYSILLGALTVLVTFFLAREIFPERPEIAWGATLLVAFLPQFLFISGAVSNDNLATFLSVVALWQLVRITHRGLTAARAVGLGIVIGAALLTKLNTFALLPLASLAILYAGGQKRDWRGLIVNGALVAGMVALVAGWWYWRNVLLYGDPTTFARLAVLVGQRPRTMGLIRWASAESEGLRLSAWGTFGWFNILASPPFYLFYDGLAAIGMIGMIVALVSRRPLPVALALLLLWLGLVFLALWEYASNIITSQGRLLFPALAAWAVLWSWGINTLLPSRLRSWVIPGLAVVLVLIAALVPGLVIAPAYTPIRMAENAAIAEMAPLDWRFDNGIEWAGATVEPRWLHPGDSVDVTIYQRVPAGTLDPPAIFIHLVNTAGSIVAQRDTLLASGNLRPLSTPAIVADSFRIPVPIGAPAPDIWSVEMGMYDPAMGTRSQATDREGRTLGDTLMLGTLSVQAAPAEAWNFDFDGRVTLAGVKLSKTAIQPGESLPVVLNWSRRSSHSEDLHVFVHALGENESMRAGVDVPLASTPTQELNLIFDEKTPPGFYRLEVGIYPNNGDRLAVFDRLGQDANDRVFVGPVRVIAR